MKSAIICRFSLLLAKMPVIDIFIMHSFLSDLNQGLHSKQLLLGDVRYFFRRIHINLALNRICLGQWLRLVSLRRDNLAVSSFESA